MVVRLYKICNIIAARKELWFYTDSLKIAMGRWEAKVRKVGQFLYILTFWNLRERLLKLSNLLNLVRS
jgi:hypothetical protein